MADEILTFDAAGSNVDGTDPGTPLSIGAGTSYQIVEASFPAPPLSVLYSSSVDTEGESPVTRKHGNRQIDLRLGVDESGAVTTLADALAVKFAKLQREGGTLKRTRKDGSVRIYDIVAGDGWQIPYDQQYILAHSADVPFTLPAAPYARGAESDLGDNVETTSPALVFTEASIPGDVPALGRLVVDNDASADQWWVTWGLQSKNYSSSANAALFYEAEGRTPLGGSAIAVGSGTPSGAGSNVMRNTALTPTYQAVMGTQATGAGAHLTHIGTFRVYMRLWVPTTNTGQVTVALEWAEGDYRAPSQNEPFNIPTALQGSWVIGDLGPVTVKAAVSGAQRWEGRLLAKSTVLGDDLDVDWMMLVPVEEGSGTVAAVARTFTPTTFSARDEFDHAAGALAAKVLPVGGTWAGAGDTDDFNLDTTYHWITRAAASDATPITSRFALAGATTYTTIAVSVAHALASGTASLTVGNPFSGVLLRYVDASNWAAAGRLSPSTESTPYLVFITTIAGVQTFTFARSASGSSYSEPLLAIGASAFALLQCSITSAGQFTVSLNGITKIQGSSGTLATGGTLASGRVGLLDYQPRAAFPTRLFDNFWAAVPPLDAAMFASQSLEVRHNSVIREDSTGSFWTAPSSYIGDYLTVPVSGAEARTARVIVKPSRGAPSVGADTAIDDVSARLFVTPRYL